LLSALLVTAAVWAQTPPGAEPNANPGGTQVVQAQPGGAQPGGAQPPTGGAQPPQPQPGGGQLPQPRVFPKGSVSELLGTYHPRLEGLPAGVRPPVGTTPVPNRETIRKYVDLGPGTNFVDPEFTIDLVVGIPRIWNMKVVPFRTQVADPRILDITPIGPIPAQYSLIGQAVGTTVLNLWVGDPNDLAKQVIFSYKVNVLPDPEAKERLERVYKALEDEINKAFPDAYVCLFLVGDKLVVTGQVKDAVEATQILQILRANAPAQGPQGVGNIPAQANIQRSPFGLTPLNLAAYGGQAPNTINDYIIQGEQNLVNLLRIVGEQQVMLKVTVAEVSRTAARAIGFNETFRNKSGVQYFANTTGTVSQNLPTILDNGKITLAIEALRTVGLAKSLAEPNLVTMNGRPATFLAGGEFPVPVVTGATAVGLQGTSFVPFGVFLTFVPLISDKDKIQLELSAQVSVRDVTTGTNVGGSFVPGLTTRNVVTTVQMREGQTLAIAGLIQNNMGGNSDRVPFFGDIPFPGQLFRTDRTQAGESELVLLVTPELVHPMEPKEIPPLPGSDYFEPSDLEFYLHGRLESWRPYSYRSPVMNEIHRMCAYRRCELLYFVGPHGHGGDK
jgi:pilus assembly protein CpaC